MFLQCLPNLMSSGPRLAAVAHYYKGYLLVLWSLQSPQHGWSRFGTDGGGWTGGTQGGQNIVMGRQEFLGERVGMERLWFGAVGAAGPAAQEGRNIYKTIYVS